MRRAIDLLVASATALHGLPDAQAQDPSTSPCTEITADFSAGVGDLPWGTLADAVTDVGPDESFSVTGGCLVIGDARFERVTRRFKGAELVEVTAAGAVSGTVEALEAAISAHHGASERDVRAMTHYQWADGELRIYLAPRSMRPDGTRNISLLSIEHGPKGE